MFTVPGQQHLNTWLFLVLFILCLDGVIWSGLNILCIVIWLVLCCGNGIGLFHTGICVIPTRHLLYLSFQQQILWYWSSSYTRLKTSSSCVIKSLHTNWAGQWVTAAAVDLWPTWAFHVHISETEIDWSKFVNWFLFQLGNYSWLFVSEPWALLTLFSCH